MTAPARTQLNFRYNTYTGIPRRNPLKPPLKYTLISERVFACVCVCVCSVFEPLKLRLTELQTHPNIHSQTHITVKIILGRSFVYEICFSAAKKNIEIESLNYKTQLFRLFQLNIFIFTKTNNLI